MILFHISISFYNLNRALSTSNVLFKQYSMDCSLAGIDPRLAIPQSGITIIPLAHVSYVCISRLKRVSSKEWFCFTFLTRHIYELWHFTVLPRICVPSYTLFRLIQYLIKCTGPGERVLFDVTGLGYLLYIVLSK